MMFSQRFPSYFDGIIAVAPAMRVAEGASIAAAWTTQRFLDAAPKDADGKPVLAQAMSEGDLKLVAGKILESCDARDGLKDGLVQDPASCQIDPASLRCTGARTDSCLKAEQVDALRAVMAGPKDSSGKALYFPWPWDPGIVGSDWRRWTLGTSATATADSRHQTLISGALGYEFATPADPSLNVVNFNFDRDPARLKAFAAVYNTGEDVDLAGFRRRQGKLLMIHGLADPIFSASESMDYMRRLQARHGAAAGDFARLFVVPGMNHCDGGPSTDAFDGLGAIERWVEKGEAPDRILAHGTKALPGVNRPLCSWPKVARYRSGDERAAASFECR
jgi:feruloyl esterase